MKIYHTTQGLRKKLDQLPATSSIGFVPTMGALHQGHVSLVKTALKENSQVVVSIFVNPTQFDNATDLQKYPRTIEEDASLLEKTSSHIIVFAPTPAEIYGNNIVSKAYNFDGLENEMEGKHREGHFDGVGTVLNHLFRIVTPAKAYFGEKDFQQLQIVRSLVKIEKLPVQIVGCPILREKSGLAMSSRNARLTNVQRREAAFIFKTLTTIKENFNHKSIPALTRMAEEAFRKNPHLRLEYFEIAHANTLKTAKRKQKNAPYRAFVAAFSGEVRLIDNMALT
ncbi:pantoate--beta-alanine ligase [Rasiella rasia]|uniref:Pantothenate synthetase n=1 Tax=Rasiella rasia TaxID=2744027 RepID=A0A6G6GPD4_9FLAO|nr:pantoate--beta-alanine ligase [Rasiella rasia]QIE59571.1 pantoate--beta-alanine ligase [Rasiella rasia]